MMNNQLYVNSAELIREIYDDYNITSDDFVSRAPAWIYNALDELNFIQAYVEKTTEIPIEHYRGKLPDDFQGLISIAIDNQRAQLKLHIDDNFNKFKSINELNPEDDNNPNDELDPEDLEYNEWVELVENNKLIKQNINNNFKAEYYISNGWIHTNIESTTAYLKYKAIPSELDTNLNMYFPLIYNEGMLRRYIKLYIIRQILLRGYKHPILSLTANNPVVNPGLELMSIRNNVRVACNKFNKDRRENIARILTTTKI